MSATHPVVRFSSAAPPVACVTCGHRSVRVAEIIGADGGVLGTTLVCTRCQPVHRAP